VSADKLVEVSKDALEVALPHHCGARGDAPIPYQLGPRGRERLAAGETVPVTARCARCDERVFLSLVDSDARARRVAAVRPDPSALRAPSPPRDPRTGQSLRPRLRLVPQAEPAPPCPACGAVPDSYGLCRCSM
jgi:hypothetical protein